MIEDLLISAQRIQSAKKIPLMEALILLLINELELTRKCLS
jgi:hypothetical protein